MPKNFDPLTHPACLSFPLWLMETAWAQHIPFGMFVVSAARPKTLVELGAWRGVSYCAFCQAVRETHSDTRCYAVDTWKGDEHAGTLGDEALLDLQCHHDPLYSDFSQLIRSTFDEALAHFTDRTIDLLHIDGFHSYEAVSHDFRSWLPKMSERGIILFHDINVRERGFGVYKLWEETSAKYSDFEFLHGHGLGVLAVGNEIPEDLQFLFHAGEKEVLLIRKFFETLGSGIDAKRQFLEQTRLIQILRSYEEVVKSSRLLRARRVLRDDGFSGLLKKGMKKL